MFYKVFFSKVLGTVKNICIKTLTFKFKRKRFLLSDKNKKAVKEAARESAKLQRALWEKRAISSREKVMKNC